MKESAIARKIMASVKSKYPTAYVRKLSDRFQRGLPDIIIVFGNLCFLAVEVKTEQGRTSPLQKVEGSEINRLAPRGRWIVATNAQSVLAVMEEMET